MGAMLSVLRRELELRGVSVAAAERAGVERVDAVGESVEGVRALTMRRMRTCRLLRTR